MRLCRWVGQPPSRLRWDALTANDRQRESFSCNHRVPWCPPTCFASPSVSRSGRRPGASQTHLAPCGRRPIQEPFLEQELWSPNGKVLTVLMHPGRVKTWTEGAREMGPILSEGDDVTLALDGLPIKRWSVGPADEIGPVPSAWKLSPTCAASKQPLVVKLDGPIEGRDADYLAVADDRDRRVAGRAQLSERRNRLDVHSEPALARGTYKLVVRGTLEDPAGNRLGSHFETPIQSPPGSPSDDAVLFEVGSSFAGSTPGRDRTHRQI